MMSLLIRWPTVYVDPNSIEYSTNTRFRPVLRHIGRVEGGDWDLDPVPLDSEATARGLRQRFEDGLDWEKTDYFAMLIESNESELGVLRSKMPIDGVHILTNFTTE